MPEFLHVAVGVIVDGDDRVLIAKRPPDVHQGGLWEFPGGKLEAGESVLTALQRELQEELNITIDPAHCHPLKKIRHHYRERCVFLDVWRVDRFRGTPRGLENQPLRWCPLNSLDVRMFPEANSAIVKLLQLPSLLAITGASDDQDEFCRKLERVLKQGVRLIQLRLPGLSDDLLRLWAGDALRLCEKYHARLLVNCNPAQFAGITAHGLHVNSGILMELERRPVGGDFLFSASCHSAAELEKAEALNADLVLLSPVQPTTSHPAAAVLGWSRFRELADQASLPVFALGGLGLVDLARARQEGAHGIAAIGAFWQ